MVKKVDGKYVMDTVCEPRIVERPLTEGEVMTWQVESNNVLTRFVCGACGECDERADIVVVWAHLAKERPDAPDRISRHGCYICDECVRKEAPDLHEEVTRKRVEEYALMEGERLPPAKPDDAGGKPF